MVCTGGGCREEEDDLLRIDWKKHRASREDAEAEKMAEKTLWEIADEAAGQESWEPEDVSAEESEFPEDVPDMAEEPEDDLLEALASLEAVYEDEDSGEDGEFDLLTEDEKPAEEEFSEEDFLSDIAREYIKPSRSQAAKAADMPKQQPAQNAGTGNKKKEPGDLDELFYDEAKNVSLTGEFDIIFNSKKSAANVSEISRQPLVEATKPEKPKKHSTK